MVFNNISVMSMQSFLMVEEIEIPGFKLITLVVIDTHCKCSWFVFSSFQLYHGMDTFYELISLRNKTYLYKKTITWYLQIKDRLKG